MFYVRRKSLAWLLSIALAAPGFGLGFSACAQDQKVPKVAPRPADTLVMLPDGSTVHVELAKTEAERQFGLMERTSLPQGRGMLFIHDQPGQYPYWMYDCKIGLDIIWMDLGHRIVEMSPKYSSMQGQIRYLPELWRPCHFGIRSRIAGRLDQGASTGGRPGRELQRVVGTDRPGIRALGAKIIILEDNRAGS